MKKTISLLVLSSFLISCGTTTSQRCSTYEAAYATYLAIAAVRKPDKQELDSAHAAAIALKLYCGWNSSRGADSNGVPVLTRP